MQRRSGFCRRTGDCLDKIAEFLIEKETITGKEFMEIFHKVKAEEDGYQQEELIFAE